MFVGVFDRSIDDNGRLGLPAPFRGELGDRCYATLDPQGCITLRTVAVFEAEANDVIEAVKSGTATARQRVRIVSSVRPVHRQRAHRRFCVRLVCRRRQSVGTRLL